MNYAAAKKDLADSGKAISKALAAAGGHQTISAALDASGVLAGEPIQSSDVAEALFAVSEAAGANEVDIAEAVEAAGGAHAVAEALEAAGGELAVAEAIQAAGGIMMIAEALSAPTRAAFLKSLTE
jgi:hypothetical protein